MSNLKLWKKILMEAFQWAAFATPIFLTGQRFATKECINGICDTNYWLLVTASIAYVAGITLIAWLPVKIFVVWKKVFRPYEGLWFPGTVMYVVFCAVPCAIFVLLAHENCSQASAGNACFDYFRGGPIETLIIMLVVTDWSEKIRYIKLRSQDDSIRRNKYTTAAWDGRRGTALDRPTSYPNGNVVNAGRSNSLSETSMLHSSVRNKGLLRRIGSGLKWIDARPENLIRDLLHAYDARLMLDLSTLTVPVDTSIFESNWIYPIYIFTTISFVPLALAPNSDMRASLTIILQDIPFFIIRLAMYCTYGSGLVLQSSVLFLLKNFFISFAFMYFNCVLPKWNTRKNLNKYRIQQNELNFNSLDSERRISFSAPRTEYQPPETTSPIVQEYERGDLGIVNQGYNATRDESYDVVPAHADDDQVRYRFDSSSYPPAPLEDEFQDNPEPPMEVQYPLRREAQYSARYSAIVQNLGEGVAKAQARDAKPPNGPPTPPKEPSPPPPVPTIDYDTLHNPRSFLYSQERPHVQTITFNEVSAQEDNQQHPPNISDDPYQETDRRSAVASGQSDTHHLHQKESDERASGTEIMSTEATVNSSDANTSSRTLYAKVDRESKRTRRRAPPPPTEPKTSIGKPNQPPEETNDFPPPPSEIVENDEGQTQAGDRKKSQRRDFTKKVVDPTAPNAAQQLPLEAMEAVNAMEEAASYGDIIGADWSTSTTPKNTYSRRKQNTPTLSLPGSNKDTFDIRL